MILIALITFLFVAVCEKLFKPLSKAELYFIAFMIVMNIIYYGVCIVTGVRW